MLVIEKAKALALKLSNPAAVLASIATAKPMNVRGHDIVVLPHKLDEVRVLRNLGIDAPSPIMHYYDWPGRYTPYDHQKETSAFLTLNTRGLVLNEIGCGKTASALWAADYLMKVGAVKKVLIISPLSTLERVWGDAVFTGFFNRKAVVLYGSAEQRHKLLNADADFFIVNHDGFAIVAKKAVGMFDLVIVDEAAVMRNPSTNRFKIFRRWMELNPDARLWLMTGTPTPNEPTDAWALAKLVNSPFCTSTYTAFKNQVMVKQGMYRWLPRPEAINVVQHILQPSVRYTRDECLELPDTIYQTRKVPLTPDQQKHYSKMLKSFYIEAAAMRAGGTSITAVNEAVKLQKLVQIACIAARTPVLTNRGWVPIEHVTPVDMVWDGIGWVSQGGAVLKGYQDTIELYGIRMTSDHLVLARDGWRQAQEFINDSAIRRASVRLPSSTAPSWFKRFSDSTLGVPVGDSVATGIKQAEAVYDLVNCGPRNRFIARGSAGELLIVHNCGVAYDDNGDNVEIDCAPRVKEVVSLIEQAGEKIIVFVPLTGTLRMLERELAKKFSVAVVNGEVSASKRNEIFRSFQDDADPLVLIAHPATMAHGLTLTSASTIIWYGPITSNEQYVQANGRIERIGKRHVSNVVHIEGTDLEHKMYQRLKNKQTLQGLLLDLIQQQAKG